MPTGTEVSLGRGNIEFIVLDGDPFPPPLLTYLLNAYLAVKLVDRVL